MTQTIRQIVLSLPGNLSHKLTCILYAFERRNELKLHTRCLGHARLQSHRAVSQPRTTNPFPAWPVVTQRCFTCILMAAGPARTLVVKQVENVGIYSDVRILFKSTIHKQGRGHIYSERTSRHSCWGWASSRSRSSVGFGCNVSWFTLEGWYLFAMWRKGVRQSSAISGAWNWKTGKRPIRETDSSSSFGSLDKELDEPCLKLSWNVSTESMCEDFKLD